MKLKVKIKHTIVAEGNKGKATFDIQKVGPYWIGFPLSEVRGFSDSDVEYIISNLPEYVELRNGIKRYMETLEGNKAGVLETLKHKSKQFMDIDVMSLKFKLNTKIKHSIDYEETIPEGYNYVTTIFDYDPNDNNLS